MNVPTYRLPVNVARASLLLLLVVSARGFAPPDAPSLAGRDITLTVVREDGAEGSTTATGLTLTTQPVIIRAGDKIEQLLKSNGIYPDAEALGLVYDLNPAVESLTSVPAGRELVLPKVAPAAAAPAASGLPAGHLVALKVDAQLKGELLAKVARLESAAGQVNALGVDRFNGDDEKRAVARSLRESQQTFALFRNVITGKVLPVSNEALGQLLADAETLQSVSDQFLASNQKLSAEDLKTIRLVEDDLKSKRRGLRDLKGNESPPRWPTVSVVVRMVAADNAQLSLLRVYYVPEALRRRPQAVKSFDTLGSPAERTLPEANYIIWVGPPGQTEEGQAKSEVKRIEVRKRSAANMAVELAILR